MSDFEFLIKYTCMKKIIFTLICSMLVMLTVEAKKEKKAKLVTFTDSYIYAQSGRNTEAKGSALSLTTGMTYSLMNCMNSTSTNDIDLMLYFGKAKGGKTKVFHLFSPDDPTLTINWEKDGGTAPYCKFEGKSDDPDAYFALKNWKKRNATKLQRVSEVDFDNATPESIGAMTVEENYIISDVKIGDIILFELGPTSRKAGKKGLLKVTAIEDDETKPDQKGNQAYQRFIVTINIQK